MREIICNIISEMLDNPDEHGIYQTTRCYNKLLNWHISEIEKAKREVLEKYSQFLIDCSYCDDDIWCEEPTAIDRFLKENDVK